MNGTYHGTQAEVLSQIKAEGKQARIDQMNRKLAARLHKTTIEEQSDNRPRVRFDAGWTKQGGFFGV